MRDAPADPARARTQSKLAFVLSQQDRGAEAEELLEEAHTNLVASLGELHPEIALVWCELARAYAAQQRWSEAQDALRRAREIQQTLLGPDHPETLATEWQMAGYLAEGGRLAEAEAAYAALVPHFDASYGPDNLSTSRLRAGLVRLQEYRGDRAAAWDGWLELLANDHEPEMALHSLAGLAAPDVFTPVLVGKPEAPVRWRMQTNTPPPGWELPGFDDRQWTSAPAPFGYPDTHPQTVWTSPDLWLRTRVDLEPAADPNLVLRVRHDDRLRVWLDGVLVATNDVWSCGGHWLYPVPASALTRLNPGRSHVLAVHVEDTGAGGHANVELYRATDPDAPARRIRDAIAARSRAAPADQRWARLQGRLAREPVMPELNRSAAAPGSDQVQGRGD